MSCRNLDRFFFSLRGGVGNNGGSFLVGGIGINGGSVGQGGGFEIGGLEGWTSTTRKTPRSYGI